MPYEGEHSCRLHDPGDYVRFRRQDGLGHVDGKRLDAIIGFKKDDGSEVQAFRYRLSEGWTAAQAGSHCGEHAGSFEAATGEKTMFNLAQLEKELREQELEALEAYRKGTAEAPVLYKPFGSAFKSAEQGLMTFVASEETEDRLGDVIKASGWELEGFKRNPIYLFAHDHSIAPIGTVPRVWVDEKRLMNMVKWDEADPFALFVKGKYERGVMKAQSVGFLPLEFRQRSDGGRGLEFTRQELLEISAVAVPAHPGAVLRALGDRRFGIVLPVLAEETRAEWDMAWINDLPDSAFAVVLPGGEKDEAGKTVPRNLRKLPHHGTGGGVDLPHLRNALARLPQTDMPGDAKAKAQRHLDAHAKAEEVGEAGEKDGQGLASERAKDAVSRLRSALDDLEAAMGGSTSKGGAADDGGTREEERDHKRILEALKGLQL